MTEFKIQSFEQNCSIICLIMYDNDNFILFVLIVPLEY